MIPWEQRTTAVAAGFDPTSLTERAARRRTSDAALGRVVVVPAYLDRPSSEPYGVGRVGLLLRLSPAGDIRLFVPAVVVLNDVEDVWRRLARSSRDSDDVVTRDGWCRVPVGDIGPRRGWRLVLRTADWALLAAAVRLRFDPPKRPQDAPVERVPARFLGRLDGQDGTPSAGLWGRLALEVVSLRHPERLTDTLSLRWHASWGRGGFPAGSGGRAEGAGGSAMLLDLRRQQVVVQGRPFRVRTLPDWEREQAAYDLGLSPRRLLAWPVVPLSTVTAWFDDITPAPLPVSERRAGLQDAP